MPFITGALLDKNKRGDSYNYTPVFLFLGSLSTIGAFFNCWLYVDDIKNRKGVLNNVPKQIEELITSPTGGDRKSITPVTGEPGVDDSLGVPIGVEVYEFNKESRDALRRSLAHARNSFAK